MGLYVSHMYHAAAPNLHLHMEYNTNTLVFYTFCICHIDMITGLLSYFFIYFIRCFIIILMLM